MWQRFTERAQRIMRNAYSEAARRGAKQVGTEHLLLGLIQEGECAAVRVLGQLGLSLEQIRIDVERRLPPAEGHADAELTLSPRAESVADLAYEEGRRLANNYLGTEHILLGLVREADGVAARVLIGMGAEYERVRREVILRQEGDAELGAFTETLRQRIKRHIPSLQDTMGAEHDFTGEEPPTDVLRWIAGQSEKVRTVSTAYEASRVAVELARTTCREVTDLRGVTDLSREQLLSLLLLGRIFRHTLKVSQTAHREILAGQTLAMIFEKPSLRTRVSFETGMFQLGGHAIYLQPADIRMGEREPVADVARNLERFANGIMARVFSHQTIVDLANAAQVPVINGLCDREHPCQALADLMTIRQHRGQVRGNRIAYLGDGNNVAHSLALAAAKIGAHVVLASPAGYEADSEIIALAQADAAAAGGSVTLTQDPAEACKDADVIYTDVWASMGQEAEAAARAKLFAPYQVNEALTALAKPNYLFMHCLPAHRGEEVSAAVMDGPNSVVFDQAENRLHAQKAVLAVLLG